MTIKIVPSGNNAFQKVYAEIIDDSGIIPASSIINRYAPRYIDSNNAGYTYYGFEAIDGSWFIQKKTIGILSTISYVKGDSDLDTNWGNRTTTLVYDSFANTFG